MSITQLWRHGAQELQQAGGNLSAEHEEVNLEAEQEPPIIGVFRKIASSLARIGRGLGAAVQALLNSITSQIYRLL